MSKTEITARFDHIKKAGMIITPTQIHTSTSYEEFKGQLHEFMVLLSDVIYTLEEAFQDIKTITKINVGDVDIVNYDYNRLTGETR